MTDCKMTMTTMTPVVMFSVCQHLPTSASARTTCQPVSGCVNFAWLKLDAMFLGEGTVLPSDRPGPGLSNPGLGHFLASSLGRQRHRWPMDGSLSECLIPWLAPLARWRCRFALPLPFRCQALTVSTPARLPSSRPSTSPGG